MTTLSEMDLADLDYVQWIGRDGGWKTGQIVRIYNPCFLQELAISFNGAFYLVRHSHTGELEWVSDSYLEPRPMRKEFEDKDGKPLRPRAY